MADQPPPQRDQVKPAGDTAREVPSTNDYAGIGPDGKAGQSTAQYVLGIVFLVVAISSGLMLVLESLGGISLPGCGEGSACAQATASFWGKVPGTDWPVSFLGFAYFAGAFIAWLGSRRGITSVFRNVARLGALISLGFVLIIFIQGHHCSYCLVSHAGNFAFWIVMETSRKASITSLRPVLTLGVVFIIASVVLGTTKWRTEEQAEAHQNKQLDESIAEIVASDERKKTAITEQSESRDPVPSQHTTEAAETTTVTDTTVPAEEAGTTNAATTAASEPAEIADATETTDTEQEAIQRPWQGGFRGRYLWGSEESPVRLVMLTDYQCRDCTRIEEEVREMLNERDDVSLSIKHFPMCTDCNTKVGKNMHPNACWAARAAEAAGILGGEDGFWDMHFWLFDHKGSFTNEILVEGLYELDFDPTEFIRVMSSDETLELVQSDIEEGQWLGLHFTPMVFINGVELKGIFAKNAIPRAVAAVAARNPPAMTHEHDQPPPAAKKYVADWREKKPRRLPLDKDSWTKGPANARVKIVMWGDYQEKQTKAADRIILEWMADRPSVQYTFRHFPFNQDCNSVVSRTVHPEACRAAQAAEAAGNLAGKKGFWRMHDWLMSHQEDLSDEALRQAATEMGLDADALFAEMDKPRVSAAIQADAKAGKPMLYRGGIPTIYVNAKVIPRWRLEGTPVLERILDDAYGK